MENMGTFTAYFHVSLGNNKIKKVVIARKFYVTRDEAIAFKDTLVKENEGLDILAHCCEWQPYPEII